MIKVKAHKRKGKKVRAHTRKRKVLSHGRIKRENKALKKNLELELGSMDKDYQEMFDRIIRDLGVGFMNSPYQKVLDQEQVRAGRKMLGRPLSKAERKHLTNYIKEMR